MKNYHYLIIELRKHNSEMRVKIWNAYHKKHKRFAKRAYRKLKKHCGSVGQYVFVKVNETLKKQ